MKKPIVFMFSGQGTQYYHMGRELFENNSVFHHWMCQGNTMAKELLGMSIIDHIYANHFKKSDPFQETLLTHPSIFLIEYALAQTLFALNIKPDYVFGISVGEFASVAIANVLPFDDVLYAAIKQAKVLHANCQLGSMIAIFHDPALFNKSSIIHENSTLVGIPFNTQFVISTKKDAITQIEQFLLERAIAFQTLPVSIAFHSNLIDHAKSIFMQYLQSFQFKIPQISFISGSKARILRMIPNDYLWEVIREPIDIQNNVKRLEENIGNIAYIDCGPSGTMAAFVKYNLPSQSQSTIFPLLTPFGRDLNNLEKLQSEIT